MKNRSGIRVESAGFIFGGLGTREVSSDKNNPHAIK